MSTTPPAGPTDSASTSARSPGNRTRTDRSRPRLFFVGMALFMTTVVFLGFWPTYFGPLLVGAGFDGHWILHVHAFIYMGWMAVLLA